VGNRELVGLLLERERIEGIIHLAAFALVPESVAQPQKYVTKQCDGRPCTVGGGSPGQDPPLCLLVVVRGVWPSGDDPITEDAPLAPVNPYGETKRDFERLLAEVAPQQGMAVVSLRYFNASGATEQRGEDHDPETHLIPNVLGAALGNRGRSKCTAPITRRPTARRFAITSTSPTSLMRTCAPWTRSSMEVRRSP